MILGYCIRRAGEPGPDAASVGVGGAAVRLLEAGALGMWVSDAHAGRVDPHALREHDRVVRAALGTATPLPLRFGTRFADAEDARAALRTREVEFLEGLDRVAGRVEMGVRLLWAGALEPRTDVQDAAPVASGREYLERRRRQLQSELELRSRADALLRLVDGALADLELPTVREVVADGVTIGTLAHLVQRAELPRYRAYLEQVLSCLAEADAKLSGPWAPYSFV